MTLKHVLAGSLAAVLLLVGAACVLGDYNYYGPGGKTGYDYIYPFENQAYSDNWAEASGHNVDISAHYDYDDTTANNCYIRAESNDADDYDYLSWVFNLPDNFTGFYGPTPLSIDVLSSDYANTALEITLNVNGAQDSTVTDLGINPSADDTWQIKTSSFGGTYTADNAGQRCYVTIKFLGDDDDVLRVKNLKLRIE
jgi:hypothetical protein